jgi:hypothetical protein
MCAIYCPARRSRVEWFYFVVASPFVRLVAGSLGSRLRGLQLCAARHHPLQTDTDTLDDRQQYRAADGIVPCRLETSSNREGTAGEEAGDDGIVWVLLLAYALDGAVKCREQAAPDTKVATEHGRAHLDGRHGAETPLSDGRVPESLYAVPYRAANGLRESAGGGGGVWVWCCGMRARAFLLAGSLLKEGHTPMEKAAPKSLMMTQGHGSRA